MRSWSSPETAERVLAHIAANTDEHNEAICSNRVIGDALGINPATVSRALARLVDDHALAVVRPGTRYPAVYRVLRAADERLANRYATAPVAG